MSEDLKHYVWDRLLLILRRSRQLGKTWLVQAAARTSDRTLVPVRY